MKTERDMAPSAELRLPTPANLPAVQMPSLDWPMPFL